jgi:ADP-ribosyl-[dinitrogen reductase] hydrolase
MDRYSNILRCLLWAAVGDAVGLRREGLSRQRAMRMYGGAPLKPNLLFGCGFFDREA